jgi:hypothetical protein
MAVFFLLLAVLVGVVLGDALVENESTGALTLFGQSTDQFTDGQLLLGFAGLGILFALLLVLSVSSTRRRRARRKERRTASRELEDRATELERDNARLRSDLAQQEEALAGREAELAHRDRQLALKDEELARLGVVPTSGQEAARGEGTTARREPEAAQREDDLPRRDEEPGTGDRQRQADEVDRHAPEGTAVLDHASSASPEVSDRSRAEATEAGETTRAEPTRAADQVPPVADASAAPTEVQGRPVVAGPASPAGGAASSGPILSPDAEPVAPLHDEPPWQAARADDRTRPAQGSDAAGDRPSQAGGGAPTEDSAGAGDDDRTRPMQRPDRNA